jgi:hypothetical protein
MATGIQQELSDFHQFIGEKLASGAANLSPEEALDLWRAEHPSEEEFAETVAALKESLADMEAGDKGMPFEEFDRQFRQAHPELS